MYIKEIGPRPVPKNSDFVRVPEGNVQTDELLTRILGVPHIWTTPSSHVINQPAVPAHPSVNLPGCKPSSTQLQAQLDINEIDIDDIKGEITNDNVNIADSGSNANEKVSTYTKEVIPDTNEIDIDEL